MPFCSQRSKLVFYFLILLWFIMIDWSLAERIRNKPVYTGYWKGTEIKYVAGEFIVEIKEGVTDAQIDSLLDLTGTFIIHDFDKYNFGLVGCDTTQDIFSLIDTFESSPLIELAEPNAVVEDASAPSDSTPNDSLFANHQWNLKNTGQTGGALDADIDAVEAWSMETGDPSIIIAVIDRGIPLDTSTRMLTHPDLDDPSKYILGYDYLDDDSLPEARSDAHGTEVLGVVGAETNNQSGIAGVCWHCRFRIIKHDGSVEGVCKGIQEAIDNGAKIINCSFGWFYPYESLEKKVRNAARSGCLITGAAHNYNMSQVFFPAAYASYGTLYDTINGDTVYYNKCCYVDGESTICRYDTDTCGYRNVIAVANYTKNDRRTAGTGGSNWSNDSTRITVAAPAGHQTLCTTTLPSHGYYTYQFGGTSGATPHISGIAGLLWSADLSLTPDSIRTIIENTADDVGPPGWDDSSGYGRANALRALAALKGYYPNASGHIKVTTHWKDTVYLISDVVVLDTVTLNIDTGTVIKVLSKNYEDWGVDPVKCEIIVKGKLRINGTVDHPVCFAPINPDSGWYGIRVLNTDSASARVKYANINYAYAGITYENAKNDTVRDCHFYNNQMYGIKCSNTNLKILGNTIEKDPTSNYLGYGIAIIGLNKSPVIKENKIRNYKYGIDKSYSGGTPTITENLIENGEIGINFTNAGTNTIKKICADGKFTTAYIKNYGGTLNIDSCYLEGDASNKTPKGLWYTKYAGGYIQRSGVFNYESSGLYAYYSSPYLAGGHNSIYSFIGGRLVNAVYHIGNLVIEAEENWWGTVRPDTVLGLFVGGVTYDPWDIAPESLYNACSGFEGVPKMASSEPSFVEKFSLSQNYPNPFNPATTIPFQVNSSRLIVHSPIHTTLTIYNILGQKVRALVDEEKLPGEYKIVWDGKDDRGNEVSSGIYFYRVKAGDEIVVKKMVLVK